MYAQVKHNHCVKRTPYLKNMIVWHLRNVLLAIFPSVVLDLENIRLECMRPS